MYTCLNSICGNMTLRDVPTSDNNNSRQQFYNIGGSQEIITRAAQLSSCGSIQTEPTSQFLQKIFVNESVHIVQDEETQVNYFKDRFVQECVLWHNLFRRRHRVPPLKLNLQLCQEAQYVANFLAHSNDFYYRKFHDIGENLYCRWHVLEEFDVTGEMVAKHWYLGVRCYNYELPEEILHVKSNQFTQLVWKSSKQVGIGKARNRTGKYIVVALYKPAGNVIGEFHNNVLAALKKSKAARSYSL